MSRKANIICKNVFKGHDSNEIQRELLKKWVEIINYFESVKTVIRS